MKKFQYQILRFCPDKVTGEFLNVGIIVFDPIEQDIEFKILKKFGSIGQIMSFSNTRYLLKQLNSINSYLEKIKSNLSKSNLQLTEFQSIEDLSNKALVKDDSALYFSKVHYSLDVSISHLLNYLSKRLLTISVSEMDNEIKSDKEVWSKMFKKYFDECDISSYLSPRTIETKYDTITFDHSWKNGHINFFESVNFDLNKDDNIKNKVRRWAGQIDELKTVGENLHLYLLANMPDKNLDMEEYINSFLTDKSSSLVKVEIINQNEGYNLARSLKEEILHHEN